MNFAPDILLLVWGVVLVGIASVTVDAEKVRFDKHRVYRATPTTEEHLNSLQSIEEEFGDAVSFWSPAKSVHKPVDMMVSPEKHDDIISIFKKSDLSHDVFIPDVQALIDNHIPDEEPSGMNWIAYHRLDVIYEWLDELAATYPNWVEVLILGNSYEGRPIKAIQIIFDEDNPGIFLDATIHCREWITTAAITYLINEILSSTDPQFNSFVQSYNWFIVPVINPDGYEYTHTTNRMWRKTKRPYENGCLGADPNRNFGDHWLVNGGASNYSCRDTYAGPEPFSEIEVKVLVDYMDSVKDRFYVYISLHSYSQMILFPRGYTTERIDNYDEAMQVGMKAAEAFARRYGTQFAVGSIAETIYIASGDSADYVKAIYGTPFVYIIELRDKGNVGFLLPANEIIPSALELIDSIIALIEETRILGYPKISGRV